MPSYEVKIPNKGSFEVNSDKELTEAQAYQYALIQANKLPDVKEPLTAGQVATGAVTNFPSSFANLIGNIYQAVTSPVETVKSVLDVGAGALQNVLPEKFVQFVGEDKQSREMARKVGEFYAERYGTGEGLKKAIAQDPAGVLADLSTVLTGGATVAPRIVAQPLSRIASTIDPLAVTARATGATAKGAGNILSSYIGATTGAGKEAIAQAFEAGRKGGEAAEQFRVNISGKADQTEVVAIAKRNLEELNRQKLEEYRSGMIDIKKDKTILGFDDIDKAIQNATKKVSFKGQVTNKTAAEKLQDVQDKVSNWKSLNSAEFHTPEGLDALKKQIGETLETIDFKKEKTAYGAVSDIYNSVKTSIQKQAPTYAKTMKAYTEASDQIKEIQKTLNLDRNASVDTQLRKLTSLMRDNVQTNFGQRVKLGKQLEEAGGEIFMPGIAGQALSSITPRAIQGALTLPTSLAGYSVGGFPAVAASLLTSSPRAMGETAFATGLAARGADQLSRRIPFATNQVPYNLLYQGGQMQGLLGE